MFVYQNKVYVYRPLLVGGAASEVSIPQAYAQDFAFNARHDLVHNHQSRSNFHVASPLGTLTKNQVQDASKRLGLPNWNHAAASPCLRSRLALDVEVRLHLCNAEAPCAYDV